jgi:hypothetical protein
MPENDEASRELERDLMWRAQGEFVALSWIEVMSSLGRARECRLGPTQLEDSTGWIDGYRRVWERRLDRASSKLTSRMFTRACPDLAPEAAR